MRRIALVSIIVCILFGAAAAQGAPAAAYRASAALAAAAATVERVPGGPEVVLEPHPGAGAVCVVVSVPVGSAYETSETRGISHVIEHMVFDGSERYSRVDMSGWVDDVGGFLNAFTRKETTVYFLVVPSQFAEKGMEILSQMLFHSLFPPVELDKERKVIAEEIRREVDDPQSARDRTIDRSLYRGSPLAEPVIGYPSTIETMSRDEVTSFYANHYLPSRMRVILMGDFESGVAMGWIRDCFTAASGAGGAGAFGGPGGPGAYGAASEPSASATREAETVPEPRWSNEIDLVTDAAVTPGFDMLIPFPSVDERDFPAALLVSEMLGGPASPLPPLFKAHGLPEPEVSLETHREFSALRIHVDAGETAAAPYDSIPDIVAGLAFWRPTEQAVAETRVSFSSGEMFDREMYHLYVMSNGEGIGLFGKRYVEARSTGIEKVKAGDCARVLKRVFEPLRFNAVLVGAAASSPNLGVGGPVPLIEALPNGITAAALERPGSPVAALHLLFEGRNCAEGAALRGGAAEGAPSRGLIETTSPRGLAEFFGTVMRTSRAGAELMKELDAIGARVHFGDNPFVPQDDYILNPAFSFVRLECPVASTDRAISLLVRRILAFDFTSEDLDAAKKTLAREVGMRSGSPGFVLRSAIYRELFGAHPFGASIFPTPPAIQSVTAEELAAFAKTYLVGGNMIASFVSPEEPSRALVRLKPLLSTFPVGPVAACPPIPSQAKSGPIEMPTKKEGAYLSVSWLVSAAGPVESASILVAAEALSRRMQLELREKLGLAYSTDCTAALVPGGAVVFASLGTGAARLAEAQAALGAEIKGFGEHPPDAAEAAIAKSRLIGKRTRSELSSINKAYAIGLDLSLGGTGAGYQSMNGLIASAPLDGVTKVIAGSFSYDKALRVTLVPEAKEAKEGKETKETMQKPPMMMR